MKPSRRKTTAGVTLLEVMIVLAIMSLVVGLVAPRLIDSFGRAKGQAAEIKLANIKGALQLYYIDVGRYPTEADGLQALIVAPAGATNWKGPYVEGVIDLTDPWDRLFVYRQPGVDAPFAILSFGRDGQPGGSSEDSDISL